LIFGETGKLAVRRGGGHFCDEPYVTNTVKSKNVPTTKYSSQIAGL